MKNRLIIGVFYLIGMVFLSFGISMIILAGLGAGPWDALFVALSTNVGLTVGSWTFIIGFVLIILNGLLLKKKPDFAALITMFLIGGFVDFWLLLAFSDLVVASVMIRAAMLIIGILCSATGIASYLQSNFARNPIDHAMMVFHELTGKSLSFSKTFIEVVVLIIAFFIGGPIGFGTVLVALGIGPLIQVFYKPITTLRIRFCSEAFVS
ncbi:YczE/YyaS/YitT family protein [Salipaludibacillus sp. HK11]|uniref:YczE/YyaS/YitT family protein n=1 Tax=Salipaludibacillus sp. HK11 TaxID=3394320 RepID=UPI0039FCB516